MKLVAKENTSQMELGNINTRSVCWCEKRDEDDRMSGETKYRLGMDFVLHT